jgi:hypothetical protein
MLRRHPITDRPPGLPARRLAAQATLSDALLALTAAVAVAVNLPGWWWAFSHASAHFERRHDALFDTLMTGAFELAVIGVMAVRGLRPARRQARRDRMRRRYVMRRTYHPHNQQLLTLGADRYAVEVHPADGRVHVALLREQPRGRRRRRRITVAEEHSFRGSDVTVAAVRVEDLRRVAHARESSSLARQLAERDAAQQDRADQRTRHSQRQQAQADAVRAAAQQARADQDARRLAAVEADGLARALRSPHR